MKNTLLTFLFFIVVFTQTYAEPLSLGTPFGEGMVLQRDSKIDIWGKCDPNRSVEVRLSGQVVKAQSNKHGEWKLQLQPMKAGGPFAMQISADNESIEIKELYVGEVWLAGGQSNMQFRLDQNFESEKHLEEAVNPDIHFLFVPQVIYEGHKVKDKPQWKKALKKDAAKMSAVAYFFARDLQERLKVPVGIICDYKGGSSAEAWMSKDAIRRNPDFTPIWDRYQKVVSEYKPGEYEQLYTVFLQENALYKKAVQEGDKNIKRPVEPMGVRNYKRPCGLYETMLKPIMPYTVKGVIWYQGEANAPRAKQYQELFPAMISEWRRYFKNSSLPFYFVQLSNYDHPAYGSRPNWAELREAQLLTSKSMKNTGMAVSIDCGEKHDIHPTYKEPVGKRLASIALHKTYGFKEISYSGPLYRKKSIIKNQIELSFDYAESGLEFHGDKLEGFSICGADGKFVPADARIQKDKIIVSSKSVTDPKEVRYGWSNYTLANLFNGDGFPASPFRTDSFPLITDSKK